MENEIVDRLKNIEKMLRMLLAKEAVEPLEGTADEKLRQPSRKFNEYLAPNEIAEEVGVDTSTVRRWLRIGEIPYTKFGRAVRVKSSDFEKFARNNYIK